MRRRSARRDLKLADWFLPVPGDPVWQSLPAGRSLARPVVRGRNAPRPVLWAARSAASIQPGRAAARVVPLIDGGKVVCGMERMDLVRSFVEVAHLRLSRRWCYVWPVLTNAAVQTVTGRKVRSYSASTWRRAPRRCGCRANRGEPAQQCLQQPGDSTWRGPAGQRRDSLPCFGGGCLGQQLMTCGPAQRYRTPCWTVAPVCARPGTRGSSRTSGRSPHLLLYGKAGPQQHGAGRLIGRRGHPRGS